MWSWGWGYSATTHSGSPQKTASTSPQITCTWWREGRASQDHWLNYPDAWVISIKAELSFLPSLNGKFPPTTRTSRCTTWSSRQSWPGFRSATASALREPQRTLPEASLLPVSADTQWHLEDTQIQEAECLAEVLVLRVGTRVLTDVEVWGHLGARGPGEEGAGRQALEKRDITVDASAVFFLIVNAGAAASWQAHSQLCQNTTVSKTHNHSRGPFYPGTTLVQKWQEAVGNLLVAMGRS
nr:macrophage-expressed gene 1 protein [Oryctolagus cuniculus]